MKKVAIYIPSLRGGGAERVMVTVANELAARNWSVDLVLASATGPYLSEVSSKVGVVDLKSTRVLKSVPGLAAYLRSKRPDTLLAAMSNANMAASLAHCLARSPARLVLSERSMPSRMRTDLVGKLMMAVKRWAYARADGVVAVSKGCADELVELVRVEPSKVEVIYNPLISNELFEKAAEPLDHPWFQSGQPPVVLGVGRLVDVKGFDVLIKAFALARKERPMRLVILGEGPLRSELASLARSLGVEADVQLPGFVQNPFPWMKQAELFVLTSRVEGLPGALIQARALGKKAIYTRCSPGVSEAMCEGKYATSVGVDDVSALARLVVSEVGSIGSSPFDTSRFSLSTAMKSFCSVVMHK